MRGTRVVGLWLCAVVLTACSNPAQKAERALRQGRGWAAVAEAVTTPRLADSLPTHFIVRTCDAGAVAVDEQARTIDTLQALSETERSTATSALRQLSSAMRSLAAAVSRGEAAGAERAALLDAYATVLARARSHPR